MSNLPTAVGTVLVLLAPVGLIYSWHFFMTRKSSGWRGRVSLISLWIISLTRAYRRRRRGSD